MIMIFEGMFGMTTLNCVERQSSAIDAAHHRPRAGLSRGNFPYAASVSFPRERGEPN